MPDASEPTNQADHPSELDLVISEVISEAQVQASELRPEERAYLKDHALKKPLRVLDIWASASGSLSRASISAGIWRSRGMGPWQCSLPR